ncbi:MAG: hypothetical protein ING69_01005 [Rhodocyclaceae bacterium]|nr:hypothetical protein [Rhodocyclaceae bacterium]
MGAEQATSGRRACVFCGLPPADKNKEHILPQWLLRMTGDSSRVVKFGTNFAKQAEVEFAWSSFVMPSCVACNDQYSRLENDAKRILEALVQRTSITGREYLILFDWLDKVRVGLWLAYNVLQGNPTGIEPSFHIASRIGTKDRLLAVYPIESDKKGLNAFGVESFVFNMTPSCFALRVNNLLLLNASSDFLLAARCGFPFPRLLELLLDGPANGQLLAGDFGFARRIKRPILRMQIHKPSVLLFQPIVQQTADATKLYDLTGIDSSDSFLAEHTLPPYPSGKGILFREYSDRVDCIKDLEEKICFDSIKGHECKPLSSLVAQVYDLQNYIQSRYEPTAVEPLRLEEYRRYTKLYRSWNTRVSKYLRRQPPVPT